MYKLFFSLLVALRWGVALAQGLAGLIPGPALTYNIQITTPLYDKQLSYCIAPTMYYNIGVASGNYYIHLFI